MNKKIFFCGMGGIDTHGERLPMHDNLLERLVGALGALYTSLELDLQLTKETTSFTENELGRTGNPPSSIGQDHPWGSRLFDLGGSVRGGGAHGSFPVRAVRRLGDAGSRGLWFPSKSLFPNRRNFSNPNIGFLR